MLQWKICTISHCSIKHQTSKTSAQHHKLSLWSCLVTVNFHWTPLQWKISKNIHHRWHHIQYSLHFPVIQWITALFSYPWSCSSECLDFYHCILGAHHGLFFCIWVTPESKEGPCQQNYNIPYLKNNFLPVQYPREPGCLLSVPTNYWLLCLIPT